MGQSDHHHLQSLPSHYTLMNEYHLLVTGRHILDCHDNGRGENQSLVKLFDILDFRNLFIYNFIVM